MSDKGVCRTALAKPGLLKKFETIYFQFYLEHAYLFY